MTRHGHIPSHFPPQQDRYLRHRASAFQIRLTRSVAEIASSRSHGGTDRYRIFLGTSPPSNPTYEVRNVLHTFRLCAPLTPASPALTRPHGKPGSETVSHRLPPTGRQMHTAGVRKYPHNRGDQPKRPCSDPFPRPTLQRHRTSCT